MIYCGLMSLENIKTIHLKDSFFYIFLGFIKNSMSHKIYA